MTAVLTDLDVAETFSTTDIADQLGLPHTTLWRWALQLGHQQRGSGTRIRLTHADVLICRAWVQLDANNAGPDAAPLKRVRHLVADAIRRRPAPVVVVLGPDRACTVDTWETGIQLAYNLGRGHVRWVIDLEGPA